MSVGAAARLRLAPADLAARVGAWIGGVREPPAVVALDGPSGAGKSELAADLARVLPGTAVVHLDDLYPGWDGLDASIPLLVEHVLAPLAGPGSIVAPSWDWARDGPGGPRRLPGLGPPRPGLVLVEGAGAGARACAPYLAGLIWLEAPEPARRARALARDGDAYRPHWSRWARQERAHFRRERTRERAGLVLDGGDDGRYPVVVRDRGR